MAELEGGELLDEGFFVGGDRPIMLDIIVQYVGIQGVVTGGGIGELLGVEAVFEGVGGTPQARFFGGIIYRHMPRLNYGIVGIKWQIIF